MNVYALFDPTKEEVELVRTHTNIPEAVIEDGLDIDEYSRIESGVDGNDTLLIILSMPLRCHSESTQQKIVVEKEQKLVDYSGKGYHTSPLTFYFNGGDLILISPVSNKELLPFLPNDDSILYLTSESLTSLFIKLISCSTNLFLKELKLIHKSIMEIKNSLNFKVTKKNLLALLDLQHYIIYYSSSLQANELIIERIIKSIEHSLLEENDFHFTKSDIELLEDTLIDIKQASTTAKIYKEVLDGLSDTFSNISTNDMNIVMIALTVLSFLALFPTILTSAYGMNVPLPLQDEKYMYIGIIFLSIISAYLCLLFLKKKKWV